MNKNNGFFAFLLTFLPIFFRELCFCFTGLCSDQMDHLACFSGGMFGLAAHEEKDDNSARWGNYQSCGAATFFGAVPDLAFFSMLIRIQLLSQSGSGSILTILWKIPSKAVLRSRSRLEPPLLEWIRSRFLLLGGAGSGCIFLASKKEKPCVVTKHDFKAVYNGKCDPIKDLH